MRCILELKIRYQKATYDATLFMEDDETWWVRGGHPGMFGVTPSGDWLHYNPSLWVVFSQDDEDGNYQTVAHMHGVSRFPIKAGNTGHGTIFRSKYTRGHVRFNWRCREGA